MSQGHLIANQAAAVVSAFNNTAVLEQRNKIIQTRLWVMTETLIPKTLASSSLLSADSYNSVPGRIQQWIPVWLSKSK